VDSLCYSDSTWALLCVYGPFEQPCKWLCMHVAGQNACTQTRFHRYTIPRQLPMYAS
jgi:hypothetical protein